MRYFISGALHLSIHDIEGQGWERQPCRKYKGYVYRDLERELVTIVTRYEELEDLPEGTILYLGHHFLSRPDSQLILKLCKKRNFLTECFKE